MNTHLSQADNSRAAITPSQVIALGIVAISIAWAVWLLRDQPNREEVELLSGTKLPSSELAIMEAAFDRAQLTDYRSEDGRVWVPRARQSAYMRALVDAEALPREFGGSLRRALENNSPWQSKTVQEEMLRVATQEELSLVICSMPGIERAAVLYDVDESSIAGNLRGSPVKTASVSVRTQQDSDLDLARIEAIRVLVSASIAGLSPDGVAVTDLRNGQVYAGPLDEAPSLTDIDPLLARRKVHEQYLREKVQRAITFVNNAVIDVTIKFASETQPAKRANVPVESVSFDAFIETQQPAAAANLPAVVQPPPSTPDPLPQVIDPIASVHVTIAIPERYFVKSEVNSADFDQQIEKIRNHVLPLMPSTVRDEDQEIVITTFAESGGMRRSVLRPTVASDSNIDSVNSIHSSNEESSKGIINTFIQKLNGTQKISREEWLAGLSVVVGLVAAWLSLAGSRRRQVGHPSIDWSYLGSSRVQGNQGNQIDHNSLDRVAA